MSDAGSRRRARAARRADHHRRAGRAAPARALPPRHVGAESRRHRADARRRRAGDRRRPARGGARDHGVGAAASSRDDPLAPRPLLQHRAGRAARPGLRRGGGRAREPARAGAQGADRGRRRAGGEPRREGAGRALPVRARVAEPGDAARAAVEDLGRDPRHRAGEIETVVADNGTGERRRPPWT